MNLKSWKDICLYKKSKSICQTNKKGRLVEHGSEWAVPDLGIATDFNCAKGKVESMSSDRLGWDMKDVRMGSKCKFCFLENKNKLWTWGLPGHNFYQRFFSILPIAVLQTDLKRSLKPKFTVTGKIKGHWNLNSCCCSL